MNTEDQDQLSRLKIEIEYHRKKAADYRKRAEAQDRIADERVKLAAELGTGDLPIFKESNVDEPA